VLETTSLYLRTREAPSCAERHAGCGHFQPGHRAFRPMVQPRDRGRRSVPSRNTMRHGSCNASVGSVLARCSPPLNAVTEARCGPRNRDHPDGGKGLALILVGPGRSSGI
jgi:hypothetical protein